MLGNGGSSLVRYAPQDLWGHEIKYIVVELWSVDHNVHHYELLSCTYISPASCSLQFQFASLCASHPSLSSASGAFFFPSHLKVCGEIYNQISVIQL